MNCLRLQYLHPDAKSRSCWVSSLMEECKKTRFAIAERAKADGADAGMTAKSTDSAAVAGDDGGKMS
jgi:hypothetical protein